MPRIRITRGQKAEMLTLIAKFEDQSKGSRQAADLIEKFHPVSTVHPNSLFADLNKEKLEAITDVLGDLLTCIGFGNDDEPNAQGRRIEDFIDLFVADLLDE